MTEKEYEKWTDDLSEIDVRIRNYEQRLKSIKDVYESITDKNNKIDLMTINIQIQSKHDEYSHKYYDTDSKKVFDCIKLELENEIKCDEKSLSDLKNKRVELINSLSIK